MKTIELLTSFETEIAGIADSFPKDVLNATDRTRLARIKHPGARRQFMVGRALIREACQRSGADFRLLDSEGEFPTHPDLSFNLSHVERCIVLAWTTNSELGVDVEDFMRRSDRELLMRRQYNAPENEWISKSTSELEHRQRFFTLWTIKEAILKAERCGLRIDTKAIRVDLGAGTIGFPFENKWVIDYATLREFPIALAHVHPGDQISLLVGEPGNWVPQGVDWQRLTPI